MWNLNNQTPQLTNAIGKEMATESGSATVNEDDVSGRKKGKNEHNGGCGTRRSASWSERFFFTFWVRKYFLILQDLLREKQRQEEREERRRARRRSPSSDESPAPPLRRFTESGGAGRSNKWKIF